MNRLSDRRRVLQWASFARTWWIFDANQQCPFQSANRLCLYLDGKHKPIYHPLCVSLALNNVVLGIPKNYSDCGDHIVVINTKHIAMPDRFWRAWRHFSHSGYGGGFKVERAWQVHRQDPTEVLKKQIYSTLTGNLLRKGKMARLHLYPEQEVPETILKNVSNQIRQVMPVPKPLEEYSREEQETFPRLFEWPEDHIIKEGIEFERLKEYITEDHSPVEKK